MQHLVYSDNIYMLMGIKTYRNNTQVRASFKGGGAGRGTRGGGGGAGGGGGGGGTHPPWQTPAPP